MTATAAGRLRGYDAVAKFFHWLTVALLLAQYAVGWIMPSIKRGMQPENLMNLHMSLGMVILAVVSSASSGVWCTPRPSLSRVGPNGCVSAHPPFIGCSICLFSS